MESLLRDFHELDRIRIESEPGSGRLVPVELGPLFDQAGVAVTPGDAHRGWTSAWSGRRPCTACWAILNDRLLLVDLIDVDRQGDRFVVETPTRRSLRSPVLPLPREMASPPSEPMRERLLPGVSTSHAVFADWVDEDLVVLEGKELDDFGGPYPENHERNRIIRVERGLVVGTWIRDRTGRSGVDERAAGPEPRESPNWTDRGPGYPPVLGLRERYMKKKEEQERKQRAEEQGDAEPDAEGTRNETANETDSQTADESTDSGKDR